MSEGEKFRLINPEFEADIFYLPPEEGGRSVPIHTGYRADMYYDDGYWGSSQEFIGKELCNPGETVHVLMKTLRPGFHAGKFHIGKEFEIREGPKIVGKGKVTKILRADFNQ